MWLGAPLAIKGSLNNGLSDTLKAAFPTVIPLNKPIVTLQTIPDPYWLSGFTSGEGCFWIYIFKSTSTKAGMGVNLIFSIAQHVRDEQLLKSLIKYLGCGKTYLYKEVVHFRVTKYSDLSSKIIPFFKKYSIIGVKALDFKDFCIAADMMKDKKHLTKNGLDVIHKIKTGMNRGRDV